MSLTDKKRYRLSAEDEYTHAVEEAENFNESMYINAFDHQQKMGGWFRVGNRPNEGYAEVTVCIYLPDGRVGFMFKRARISNNDEFRAAGLVFEVVEPLASLRVAYEGPLCLLSNPADMANPKDAFANNPMVAAKIDLDFAACSPAEGGEMLDAEGEPIQLDPETAFFRGHYEQHVSARGKMSIADQSFEITGLGLRDHSWGPRYWQAIHWYRWTPLAFTEDFAMVTSIIANQDGEQQKWAMVLVGNDYVATDQLWITADYDDNLVPTAYVMTIRTEQRDYIVNATILSTIPLRNRRSTGQGIDVETRITEGFTRFECDGHIGYGMSEFLDQIIDGQPVGVLAGV